MTTQVYKGNPGKGFTHVKGTQGIKIPKFDIISEVSDAIQPTGTSGKAANFGCSVMRAKQYDVMVQNEHKHIHAMKKPVNRAREAATKKKKFKHLSDMREEVASARGKEERGLCKRQKKMVKMATLQHNNKKIANRKKARVKKAEIEEDDETRLGDSHITEVASEAVLITGKSSSPYVHQLQMLCASKGIPYETAEPIEYDDDDDDSSDDDSEQMPLQVFAGMEVRTEREKGNWEVVTVLGKSNKHEGRWVVQVSNGKAVIKKEDQFREAGKVKALECTIEHGLTRISLRAENCAWRMMLYVEDINWKRHTTNQLWPEDKMQQQNAQILLTHLEQKVTPAFAAHTKGDEGIAKVHAELKVVEAAVAKNQKGKKDNLFLVGTTLPCVVDIALYAFIARLASPTFKAFKLSPKQYPILNKWCSAMQHNYATAAVPLAPVSIDQFREYWAARKL
jgi:glutathione S-transferase